MNSKSPALAPENLLDELQATLAHGTVARRVETLRRVTDLFLGGAVDYSDQQIGLFDDVFQCLMLHIETSAKALLANRLAPIDTAPRQTIRALAFDDVIEVAGPVLSQSNCLDDEALIETARNKSQAHLMAISTRKTLSGAVTDVLVLRGNDEVVQSTVNNPGAEFTERGFTRLVNRAEGDDNLATCVGLRPTIPRHLYLKLLAKASDAVRQRLEAANPQQAGRSADRGQGSDAPRALRAKSAITEQTAIAHCAGQIAVSRTAGSTNSRSRVCRSRQVRRNQRLDRRARQRAGGDRREHDDRNPRRGRDDPRQGRRACRGRRCGRSSTCATICPAWSRPTCRPARTPTSGCGPRPRSRCCASTACSSRRAGGLEHRFEPTLDSSRRVLHANR